MPRNNAFFSHLSTWSASALNAFVFVTLILVPLQALEVVLSPAEYWWQIALILFIFALRFVVSLGVLAKQGWALILFVIDKIFYLAAYGLQFLEAGKLSYPDAARASILVSLTYAGAKLVLAVLARSSFTFTPKIELQSLWRRAVQTIKSDQLAHILLLLYIAYSLATRAATTTTSFLIQMQWLPSIQQSFAFSLGLSAILFAVVFFTARQKKQHGWQALAFLFLLSFVAGTWLQRESGALTEMRGLISRIYALTSFFWLTGVALWLTRNSSWQKAKKPV